MEGNTDKSNWYRGPICATLVLGEKCLVAACGRTLLVFDLLTNRLKLEQESCLPPSLKVNTLERVSSTKFTLVSDRTFAVYEHDEQAGHLTLLYYHGSQASDQITRARVYPDNSVVLLFAHNFAETIHIEEQSGQAKQI